MSEGKAVLNTASPLTTEVLVEQLRACGLVPGCTAIAHTSLQSLGWVVGGAQSVVQALLEAVGPDGTLVMPTHTSSNSDPSHWQNPAVPEAWWPTIRTSMPAFDKARTPTWGMGVVPELFRTWPGVMRSDHPAVSFAACGPNAGRIVGNHDLSDMFGEDSPLGRLYELDANILLLGVNHSANTSLHLAEARLGPAFLPWMDEGAAMLVDGVRKWVRFRHVDWDAEDFAELGAAYEIELAVPKELVGLAETRVLDMRPLVDWAVDWLRRNREPIAPRKQA